MTDSTTLSDEYKALIEKAADHAWEKHAKDDGYIANGITSKEALISHMEKVATSPETEFFEGSNGRLIFSDKPTGTRMILNMHAPGTCMIAPHQNGSFDGQYSGEFDRALNSRGEVLAEFSPVHTVGHKGLPEITDNGFDFSRVRAGATLHTGRALNGASLAVNAAEGNYGAAAVDAASMAAETKAGSSLLAEGIEKLGLTANFKNLAHAAPLVASVIAYRNMKEEEANFLAAGRPDLAEAAYQVGKAEITAGVLGGWAASYGREITRNLYIEAGGADYRALAHSGEIQVAKGAVDLVTNAITGKPVSEVLPTSHRSMAQGTDDMGDRSEVKRIAVERTGLAANDPHNDIQTLLNENKWRPMGHLLILADGTVQGPEQGAIPFENNPRIAAGKNGETFGVMYAGQGAMNDAQASTFAQVADHLMQLRAQDGLPKDIEVIAGSTNTAELLNLPTPRGPLPNAETPQTTPQLQRRQNNSLGGF